MKYYTETIPYELAEKLKEKGMPLMVCLNITQSGSFSNDDGIHFYYTPTYAQVFDWYMSEKNIAIILYRMTQNFRIAIRRADNGVLIQDVWGTDSNNHNVTWHEAADAAIGKALELI